MPLEALERKRRGVRITLLGLVANLFLCGVKLVAGVLGHSHALIADGVESLSDLVSGVIVWRGLSVASLPADDDHPYGHGKAEPIATALVAALLLTASAWIAIQSVREILRPHSTPAPFTLVVLLAVILIKETLFRKALRESIHLESSSVRADAWHHRSDAITSLAAAVGIAVALFGGPGYEAADDWAALLAAGVIAYNGRTLWKEAVAELMDTAPPAAMAQQVRDRAERVQGVTSTEKCRIRKVGHRHFVELHVRVPATMPVVDAHRISHEVKEGILHDHPAVADVVIHIEPELPRKDSAQTG